MDSLFVNHQKKFTLFLEKKKLKLTQERKKILVYTYQTSSHFQAEDLLIAMRKEGMNVSKATIYRTLPIMVECGLLRKMFVSDRHTHYEYVHEDTVRHHLICKNCGNIVRFAGKDIDLLLSQVAAKESFIVEKCIVEVEGYCKECRFAIHDNTI